MGVLSLGMVTAAALEVPSGIASDRWGRKATLVAGSILSLLSVICYALAPTYLLLAIGGVLEGAARSFFSGNNTAMLYDTARETGHEHEYHHLLGKTSSMFQIALGLSALLGGLLVFESLRFIVLLSIIPQFLAVIVGLRMTEPQVHKSISENSWTHFREAFRHLRGHSRLKWLTLIKSVNFGIGEASYQFIAVFFQTLWPLWAIGVLRAGGNGAAAISFLYAGRMIDRFGHFPILIFSRLYGLTINTLGLLLNGLVSPILLSSSSFFFGVNTVASDHLVQKTLTDDQRATLGSLVSFIGSLVFVPASLGIGAIADIWGPRTAVLCGVLTMFGLLPVYIKLYREERAGAPDPHD